MVCNMCKQTFPPPELHQHGLLLPTPSPFSQFLKIFASPFRLRFKRLGSKQLQFHLEQRGVAKVKCCHLHCIKWTFRGKAQASILRRLKCSCSHDQPQLLQLLSPSKEIVCLVLKFFISFPPFSQNPSYFYLSSALILLNFARPIYTL